LLYYHRESYSSKYCNGLIIFTGIVGIWFPPSLPYPAYAKFRNKLNLQSQRIYVTMKVTLQMCCWKKASLFTSPKSNVNGSITCTKTNCIEDKFT
jgi:hypothetical protein